MLLLLLFFAVCGFCCLLFAVHDCESLSSKNCISNHVCVVLWVCVCVLCVFVCLCACIRLKINYRLPSSSLCCLISLTTSSAPETSINGRLSQGPANSLRSEASEAREDLRDEARLEQAVPRRLTCNVKETVMQTFCSKVISEFYSPADGRNWERRASIASHQDWSSVWRCHRSWSVPSPAYACKVKSVWN